MKNNSILLIIAILISSTLSATNYYVDIKHKGTQDGSIANPFTTLKQAADIMIAGDTCFIHEGIYRETFNPANSGTNANPIVYIAYNKEKVIVSAADTVKGWVNHSGNIYKLTNQNLNLGKKNNVFFNSSKMQLARWPNNIDKNEYTLDAKYIDKTSGTYSDSYISNNEIPNVNWTGGVIHYLGAHSGCSWQKTITNFDNANKRIHFATLPAKWPFSTHSPMRNENGHRGIFYLMNKLEALDAPGEWYYDNNSNTLYFYAPNGADPENEYVEVSSRENTMELTKNYIHIENINFFGGKIEIKGNRNKIINSRIKHAAEKIITDNAGASDGEAAI